MKRKASVEANGPAKRSRPSSSSQSLSDPVPYMPEDLSAYVPGSVVRIRMKNFLTYDHCEVFPGPRLNVVIGPNGTGKSTIVCAMALGLGAHPKVGEVIQNILE